MAPQTSRAQDMATMEGMQSTPKLSIISGASKPDLLDWTFNDVLFHRCRRHPNNAAVISQEQNVSLTYHDLQRRSKLLAAGLYALGVRKDDRVGVLLGNRFEYAEILFACSRLGAYFTLFNYAYTTSELVNALTATTPKVLLTTLATSRYNYESLLSDQRNVNPQLQHIVILDDISGLQKSISNTKLFTPYHQLLKSCSARPVDMGALVGPSDILNLQFTSGSTGLPKAAALTHHSMLNSARYIGLQMNVKPDDRINVPVPLFHAFGLIIGLCTALVYGASIVLPSEYFDAGATLAAVERYQCTGLYGVTTMFVDELSHPQFASIDRSSLRFGIMAGSSMPEELLTRVMKKFPIRDIYTNWGMTELSSIATMTTATDPVQKKLRTAGRLLPNFTGKIVDPNTVRTLPWGQRGEIVISGFGVMRGYYGDALRTDQAIRIHEDEILKDGSATLWMHTGDEGYIDPDGYFVITGRIKDLIIRGGENISPLEIEARLYELPAVKQCSVFGVPSERYGEEVAAMLELEDGDVAARPSDEEVKKWVRMTLARYKAPVHIWWIGDKRLGVPSEWPKTANGKLKKGDVKKIGQELLKRADDLHRAGIRSVL